MNQNGEPISILGVLCGILHCFHFYKYPDLTPHYAMSDLGVIVCLHDDSPIRVYCDTLSIRSER